MKTLHIAFILAIIGASLSIYGFVSQKGTIEEGNFSFQRRYSINQKEEARKKLEDWILKKFGGITNMDKNTIETEGSFYVISRNIFGKTTRTCIYTFKLEIRNDSVAVIVKDIYLAWHRSPMHKGDFGGTQYKSLQEILPLEKKVPLEKKAYRQYLQQIEVKFEKMFAETNLFLERNEVGI